jgi:hypothetical protein
MVKNTSSKVISTIIDALPYLSSNHTSPTVIELENNIVNFEVSGDVLVMETPHYLTFDKILVIDGEFSDPKTNSYSLSHSSDKFDHISNRYKVNNDIFYCKLQTLSLSSNNYKLYPEIYKLDTINFKNTKIFPISSSDITEFFNISGDDIKYIQSDPPTLTYNSRNNIFNIAFLLKDQNNMPCLHNVDFKITSLVEFITHNINKFTSSHISNDLVSLSSLSITLSSGAPSTTTGEFIL